MPRQQQVQMLPGAMKAWRKVRGLSQAGLAAATKHQVSEGLIAQIETGRRQPGLSNGKVIAAALDVPLDALAFVHPDFVDGDAAA